MSSFDTAFPKSLEYFNGDELAADVFLKKYALQDKSGNLLEETPDAMHDRLASEFHRIESKYPNPMSLDEIRGLFNRFKYVIPQGSPMSGIGNKFQLSSLSNCVVIDSPEDSYGGILKSDQELVQLAKRRCGVGIDISNIRPRGLPTSNAAKTTDGIGIFMERFSNSCREVAQNGRRGALILTISVHHPEILTFIRIKKDLKKVTGANISIRLTDEFMGAVKKGTNYTQRWPVDSNKPSIKHEVSALNIWNEIIEAAWQSAEPGLLFWDTIINESPADLYKAFKTLSVNPCSELPLSAADSCRLLLVNAWSFVMNPFTPTASFDYELLLDVSKKAQRLMDDMVDLELEAIDKIINKIKNDPESSEIKHVELTIWEKLRDSCASGRRTGLGMTGVGDAVAGMNLTYGSKKSIDLVEQIYRTQAVGSYSSSIEMAKERGSFPAYDPKIEQGSKHPFLDRVISTSEKLKSDYKKYGRRNISNLTTAPAGSVSILTQTTSGIECAFLVEYKRRRKLGVQDKDTTPDFIDDLGDKWQEYVVYHHKFKEWMKITGKTKVQDSPYHNATSNDVAWVDGVALQAAAQRWIDHAISRTTNVPSETTKETVSEIYLKAWELGCKGITIYRDGSRSGVLIANEPKNTEITKTIKSNDAPKRPQTLDCDIHHVTVKGKPYTALVGLLDGTPYEIFGGHPLKDLSKSFKSGKIEKISHGKTKPATYNLRCKNGHEEIIEDINSAFDEPLWGSFTRLLSTSLRHGIGVNFLSEQIMKGEKDPSMGAFSKVISRVLKSYIKDGTKASDKKCVSCGEDALIYQEGCLRCSACGTSKCF